jgi:hypothetical protein
MTTVLESMYVEPDRPYSQNELVDIQLKLYKSLRLGVVKAYHTRCRHLYYVKKNGRKEKEMVENNSSDCGNCSVCWKLNKVPKHLKNNANNLVNSYCDMFYNELSYITYNSVDLEASFYKWLYSE